MRKSVNMVATYKPKGADCSIKTLLVIDRVTQGQEQLGSGKGAGRLHLTSLATFRRDSFSGSLEMSSTLAS